MPLDYNYIAGFFDGEGSVRINFKKAQPDKGAAFGYFIVPHIDCSQKYPPILEQIQTTLGMGRVVNHGEGFGWIITAREDCLKFIELMKNKVVLKKRHLELLEKFFQLKKLHDFYTKRVFLEALNIAEKIALMNSKHSIGTIKKIAKLRTMVTESNYTPEDRGCRISEALKGRKFSDLSRKKMSLSAKNRFPKRKRDRFGKYI